VPVSQSRSCPSQASPIVTLQGKQRQL
jgi:hypothetical protein